MVLTASAVAESCAALHSALGRGRVRRMMILLALVFLGVNGVHAVPAPAVPGPRFDRVVHLVFENADAEDAMAQPYFAQLAREGAQFTDFRGVTHPSQPNYIAMIAGSTLGVLLDGRADLDGKHLGDQLRERGLSWKAYAQGYPGNCFLGMRSGNYVRKHVPFLSFKSVQNQPSECARVVPLEAIFEDYHRGTLPQYSMVVPDLVNDGHDTGPDHASRWFASTLGPLLADAGLRKTTLFIVTFDESESYLGPNRIYTVLLGANVIPGSRYPARADHYGILRLIQEGFGLGSLGRLDSRAPAISGIWE